MEGIRFSRPGRSLHELQKITVTVRRPDVPAPD